jgi:outer membrane protein assembly factor BamE (lipoprotein component of BamABCDE complex)
MKRCVVLFLVLILGLFFLAGCKKGTRVHYEEERTTEGEPRPAITGD